MNVLILGANGFLGQSIGKHAIELGHHVTGMARSRDSRSDPEITFIAGDRRDPNFIRDVLRDRKVDVVVDVIPMVLSDTRPLLECLDGLVAQYVMISSSDVYANYELLHRRTSGVPTRDSVDEDAPLRTTRHPYRERVLRAADAPDRYLDDYDKIPIEALSQQLSSAWTILRLPMIYGPGDKQRRFRWAISPMLKNEEKLVIPRSWGNWQSTYGYIENVGAAIALAVGDARAENRIFNIAEENPVSQLEWAQKFADRSDWSGEIEMSGDPNDPFAQRVSGLDLTVPFKISGNRFRETFGFSDVVDEPTALARTIRSEEVR